MELVQIFEIKEGPRRYFESLSEARATIESIQEEYSNLPPNLHFDYKVYPRWALKMKAPEKVREFEKYGVLVEIYSDEYIYLRVNPNDFIKVY